MFQMLHELFYSLALYIIGEGTAEVIVEVVGFCREFVLYLGVGPGLFCAFATGPTLFVYSFTLGAGSLGIYELIIVIVIKPADGFHVSLQADHVNMVVGINSNVLDHFNRAVYMWRSI